MNPFIYTTRDRWNRPVRRLDCEALAIAFLAAAIGTTLLFMANTGWLMGGAKLAARLVQHWGG